MTVRMRKDKLLVSLPKAEDKVGLIIIPKTAKRELPETGTVLMTGPGTVDHSGTLQPVDIQVGEVVYFGRHAGYEIEYKGETVKVISATDVLMVDDLEE